VPNVLRVSFDPSHLFQFHPDLYQKDTRSFGNISSQAVPGPLEACQQTQSFQITLQAFVALKHLNSEFFNAVAGDDHPRALCSHETVQITQDHL
jgi:hypothetical protein